MLNSYSSMYKNQNNSKMGQNDEMQMQPEKENCHQRQQQPSSHGASIGSSNMGDHSPLGLGYGNNFNKQK